MKNSETGVAIWIYMKTRELPSEIHQMGTFRRTVGNLYRMPQYDTNFLTPHSSLLTCLSGDSPISKLFRVCNRRPNILLWWHSLPVVKEIRKWGYVFLVAWNLLLVQHRVMRPLWTHEAINEIQLSKKSWLAAWVAVAPKIALRLAIMVKELTWRMGDINRRLWP